MRGHSHSLKLKPEKGDLKVQILNLSIMQKRRNVPLYFCLQIGIIWMRDSFCPEETDY